VGDVRVVEVGGVFKIGPCSVHLPHQTLISRFIRLLTLLLIATGLIKKGRVSIRLAECVEAATALITDTARASYPSLQLHPLCTLHLATKEVLMNINACSLGGGRERVKDPSVVRVVLGNHQSVTGFVSLLSSFISVSWDE
jgi:hypothetical protein